MFTRAGHATILSRQRDPVFRPQSCYFLQYYCICLATPSRHLDRNIFRILSCPRGSITLSRCRCRKAKKLSHAQPYCQYSTVKEDFSKSFFYKPFAGGSLFWIRLNSEQLQFSGSGTQESVTLAFCCATYELSYLLSISMSLPTSLSVSHHISFSEPPHLFSVSHNISFSEPSHLFQ